MPNLSSIIAPSNVVTSTSTDTLTNKTIVDPKVTINSSGGTARTAIVTDGSGNLVFGESESLVIPAGTTGERPQNPGTGELRFNTDDTKIEQYDGSSWLPVPGGDVDVASVSVNGTEVINNQGELKNITNADNVVVQPTNSSPADAATDIGAAASELTLTASSYGDLFGGQGGAQFQVSTVSDFATTVIDETINSGSVNSYTFDISDNLTESTEYYWRVRYFDGDGTFSLYSDATTFNTAATFAQVDTPTITSPADNATDIFEEPTITTSAFSTTGTSDTHESTDWQIATDAAFSTIIYESLDDTSNLTSLDVPAGNLQEGQTTYYVRVRHIGSSLGDSDFSSDIEFTTAASFSPTTLGQSICGGFYMGTICAASTCYYLIVAPNSTGCACCQWKPVETITSGACSTVDGFGTTYSVLNNSTHPAGNWTATRTIGGFSDWYLPAIDELEVFYNNGGGNGPGDPLPSGEDFNCEGFFTTTVVWSSTHLNTRAACYLNFNDGVTACDAKPGCFPTRAVRRVPI